MTVKIIVKRALFYSVAILCGIIGAYAMAPNYIWPAMFIGLSGFYYLYATAKTNKSAAFIAFLFGIGYHVTGLYWIGNALLVEGNEFRWVWPISVIGLPTLLSLFIAGFAYIAKRFSDPYKISGFLIFAIALSLSEWVRGHIFSGFPWNLYGHMWINTPPILQAVSIFGMFTVTTLTLLWCALPAHLYLSPHNKISKLVLSVTIITSFAGLYVWGAQRLNNNPTQYNTDVNIRVVQPNIIQDEKWESHRLLGHFKTLLSLSQPPKAILNSPNKRTYILWPESALAPSFINNAPIGSAIAETLSKFPHETYLITGALRSEKDQTYDRLNYFNSMVVFNQKAEIISVYDKSHLVPLGEYIPFQDYIPIGPVVSFSGFKPGTGTQTITLPPGDKMTPLICYEVIFPFMAKGGKERSDFILNSTNDGWYGNSAGPYQHFAQTIIRAVEHGTPIVRSANTGISGIIDPYGRIISNLAIGQRATINHPMPKPTNNITLYNKYGDVTFFVILILLLCAAAILKKTKNL